MLLLSILLSASVSLTISLTLPEERIACNNLEIMYIPNQYDFYEEAMELSFDSGQSFNNIPITRIVEEECNLREKSTPWLPRSKRSVIGRGVHHLAKLLMKMLRKGQKIIRPDLLKSFGKLLKRVKTDEKSSKRSTITSFFYTVWKEMGKLRQEKMDEPLEEMLESYFRGSLQMLLEQGNLTEMILNNPLVLDRIKRRLPLANTHLIETVEAMNVNCHQSPRDSQVVIFLKLKIPKVKKMTVEKCDDIGRVIGQSYQYYNLPAMFSREQMHFEVDLAHCHFENFTFCPSTTILPSTNDCTKDSIENCFLHKEQIPKNFYRELSFGFAVYGEFRQAISTKDNQVSQYLLKPRRLHYLLPRTGEVLIIGDKEFYQNTGSIDTVVREM